MSEEMLVRHCSPTLAGIKQAICLPAPLWTILRMRNCIRCWNRMFVKKGLGVLPPRFQKQRALV